MDYIEDSESRLLGAYKLIQMIKSKHTPSKGTFDLEESLNTLKNLEEVLKMMSQVKQQLELDLIKEKGLAQDEDGYRLTHSSKFDRGLSIERSSMNRRAKNRSLTARLMGLEENPSNTEDRCLVQLTPALGIEMLKARMLPLMGKKPEGKQKTLKDIVDERLKENDAIKNCKNLLSSYGTYIDEEAPPMMILNTPQLPNMDANFDKIPDQEKVPSKMQIQEKVCDTAEKNEVTRQVKPEGYQNKLLSSKRKRGNGGQNALPNGKKSGQKMEKANAIPISQSKLSTRATDKPDKRLASVGSSDKRVSKGANAIRRNNLDDTPKSKSCDPIELVKAKTETGAKPARKSIDITVSANNTMYTDVKIINRHCALPIDTCSIQVEQNSKQCNKAKAEDIELMLWSSESFISQARKHLMLDGNQTAYHQKKVVKCKTRNDKVLLDCAMELIVRKSQQVESSSHPIARKCLLNTTAVLSVDRLVEEIVDKLRAHHHKVSEGVGSEESVYAILEGDLKCKDVLIWDLGWLVCIQNVDYVVGQVDSVILSGLVEELVLDLVH